VDLQVQINVWEAHTVSIFKVELKVKTGLAVTQAVGGRPPTVEARVRSQSCPCAICNGHSFTAIEFTSVSIVLPLRHIHVL
jgi:hypothetical protein